MGEKGFRSRGSVCRDDEKILKNEGVWLEIFGDLILIIFYNIRYNKNLII